MRYRRNRRYKSRVVKMKFQSFVDISTQADNMQIISVNAGGPDVLKRLAPFFSAYRYYKLGAVSLKMIPASTLPVDPTGLSIEAGDTTVDPRDQLTPGMCRITNGEDILEDFTGMSGAEQRSLYENMLLDPRWYKWMLQSGVKRFGKPKYWQIGQLHQDKWPGAINNYPIVKHFTSPTTYDAVQGTETRAEYKPDGTDAVWASLTPGSDPRGLFQTGHRGTLGWMPTDGIAKFGGSGNVFTEEAMLQAIPEIELFKIITPPMHKTNYWYRCFITETVFFRDPIVMNVNGYRPVDVFHYSSIPTKAMPSAAYTQPTDATLDQNTGGNDGGY